MKLVIAYKTQGGKGKLKEIFFFLLTEAVSQRSPAARSNPWVWLKGEKTQGDVKLQL